MLPTLICHFQGILTRYILFTKIKCSEMSKDLAHKTNSRLLDPGALKFSVTIVKGNPRYLSYGIANGPLL